MGKTEQDRPDGLESANQQAPLRVVFMGTPGFARVTLESVCGWDGADVVGVYTQPDRPCGRGQECKMSEVKVYALGQGIPVYQPENFKSAEAVRQLAELRPDVLVVAAYGLILPPVVLNIPPYGAVNVHASLLPKYRGAAPIQRAILNGDFSTGISIMQMDEGMDTGDILLARALMIGKDDTAEILHDELAELGGRLILEGLEGLRSGGIVRVEQDDAYATYAPKLQKSEGEIHWDQPAQDIHDRIRAMHPWPGAFFFWDCGGNRKPLRLVLTPGSLGDELPEDNRPEPGTILGVEDGQLAIACNDKKYLIPGIKPAGKKLMSPEGFLCGYLKVCLPEEQPSCPS